MDSRIVPTEKDFFVGKCQSCRHSMGSNHPAVMLWCEKDQERQVTRPQWQCGRYEYEPGSLG